MKISANVKSIFSGISVLMICILFFSDSKSGNGNSIFNSKGEKILIMDLSVSGRNSSILYNQKDSSKNKKDNSLDGDQKISTPEIQSKAFDPNAPFTKLTFRMLRTYIPGKTLPEDLKKLDDENVEILGFMTPLNALQDMDEFLLSSAPPLNCYCAPPVFINEIIYVKLINKKTDFKTGAVRVKGQFQINTDIKDEYSDIIYSISGSDIE
ncbi:MAG TPA: DUF3299 domain-containing protein [Ignavibacteria bacterium]|nr:DUF3299 domain-containing protein [Ignavibacteria bacterium]